MKPSLPQGTRDFNAETVRKRNYILQTIKNVFELYGFQPLETPALENTETLMGKYGEEGDKLIFKILNNGLDNPAKHEQAKQDLEKVLEGKTVKTFTERALRYDLTIPFARYVAMNYGKLSFPFKRYQVQPVWRADRPQRGRYREFFQCDADVAGSNSILHEAELVYIYSTVFAKLGIDVQIHINNRKVLAGIAELCGGADKMMDITMAIDKLDKIGMEKVKEELTGRGLSEIQIETIENFLLIEGSNIDKLNAAKKIFEQNETGLAGIDELQQIISFAGIPATVIDFTLARGLNYYTGIIFEIKAVNVQMGSIGGGGRYNDLTGLFDVPGLPGVGISFGVDRIYDVMEELKLFPAEVQTGTKVLFFNTGKAEATKAFELMQQLRSKNVNCEIFHEQAKFDKQFKYAERKNIPVVVIVAERELEEGACVIKDIRTGVQQQVKQDSLYETIFSLIK